MPTLFESTYYQVYLCVGASVRTNILDSHLNSPPRRLIELRIEHADLDALIDHVGTIPLLDELSLRRMKKRRLELRDQIVRLEQTLQPKEPA